MFDSYSSDKAANPDEPKYHGGDLYDIAAELANDDFDDDDDSDYYYEQYRDEQMRLEDEQPDLPDVE